jgi:hypothetical protein
MPLVRRVILVLLLGGLVVLGYVVLPVPGAGGLGHHPRLRHLARLSALALAPARERHPVALC